MRKLLALLLLAPCALLAQIPDYVPTDGLVAWYPLDGNATDESTLGLDGTVDGTTSGTNRFDEAGKALYFDGSASVTCPSQNFPNGLTVSLWVQESEINGVSGFVFKYDGDYGGGDNSIERTFAVYRHGNSLGNRYYATASETGVAFEEFPTQAAGSLDWVHLTTVFGLDGIQYYVNGALDTDYTFNSIDGYHSSDVPITLGCSYPTASDNNKLIGTLDDIGIWNRALTPEEIEALFSAENTSALPDHIPADALIAWYPFSSSYSDGSDNGFDLCSSSNSFTTDRFGNAEGAYLSEYGAPLLTACNPSGSWPDAISYSVWFNASDLNPDPYPSNWFAPITMNGWRYDALGTLISAHTDANCSSTSNTLRIRPHWPNNVNVATPCTEINENEWYHLCVTGTPDHCKVYLNSILVEEFTLSNVTSFNSVPFEWTVGASSLHHTYQFKGAIDDVGIWGIELTAFDVAALYLQSAPINGCTDASACNYDAEANVDDGSCYSCDVPASHCGPGTHWDATLSACVVDVPSAEAAENCTLMGLQELTVGYLNLLDIVAYQDSLLTAQQGGDPSNGDGTTNNWSCGAPLPYQGYDYATVQIGDQCWFAENLSAEFFANGDAVSSLLSDSDWGIASFGATAAYGESTSYCESFSPGLDACDETLSIEEYGRLYNWHAASDPRNLCPSGWHVPTDTEWTNLQDHIILQGLSGQIGLALKAISGWDSGIGTDAFGFHALPSGNRGSNGGFYGAGQGGGWWSSTANGTNAWRYWLSADSEGINRNDNWQVDGFSIRCLKD